MADPAVVGADGVAAAYKRIVAGSATWIDTSQLTGLNDGDAISTLTDFSGNGSDATGTLALRPTYKTNIFNGLPIARFNGTANTMVQAAYTAIPQPFTVIIVLQATAGTLLDKGAAPAVDPDNRISMGRSTSQVYTFGAGANVLTGSTGITNARAIITGVINGVSSFARANGNQGTTGDGGTRTLRGFTIGSTYFGTAFMAGDFAELIVVPSQLSTSDIHSAEAFLAAKYGIKLLG